MIRRNLGVQMKKKEDELRKRNELRILKCFVYKGITGLDIMSIEIYDKRTKKIYVLTSSPSSWSYKQKLKDLKEVGIKPLDKK